MKAKLILVVICLLLLTAAWGGSPLSAATPNTAQEQATPEAAVVATGAAVEANPNVVITSPPLVSELHGTVQVMGTANLPGMKSYFLEIRELNADASVPDDSVAWIPATLPANTAVQNGLLAAWDTTQVADGLYELRLTVTGSNALSVHFIVTPLRINNAAFSAATATATVQAAAANPANPPQVTANLTANVRTGDSVFYDIVGALPDATTVPVLGISSTGSGWFLIQLPNGQKGWIAPNVVTTSGDFSNVPKVNPPPAPAGPRFTFTPVPSTTLRLTGIALSTGSPICGQGFNVQVNVTNFGSAVSAASAVSVADINLGTGTVTASNTGGVPALNPGANFVVTIPLSTTMYYNEVHQVQANLNGSQMTVNYTLAQGGCNLVPTATRTPGPTSTPKPTSTAKPSATTKPVDTPTTAATAP